MDNLKRKLSSARRPETGSREVIRELNQYKQNNAALQKQIESLMAKLNQSKKNERSLTTTLEDTQKNSTEWQDKASKAEQLEKTILALQNTIDNLEHRLELANCEKLDAEEQLYHVQSQSTPFDSTLKKPAKLQVPGNGRQSAHTSMSTVFSSDSPTSRVNESQEPSTLAAFISRIERLQEQIKQKDARIATLEEDNDQLCQNYERLEREHRELGLQSDIQGQLLRKTRESDIHIEELRTAIIKRESIIGEKEKALRHTERSLEHHKLLLHAEIRRHAAMSTMTLDSQGDPLPDLSTLASKEDIDRWIMRLQDRLKKDSSKDTGKKPLGDLQTQVNDLKQEIDFYVREIIYYKLDIKGYKSDIKKLKNITTRLGSYGSRTSDVGSPTSSLARSVDTPVRARFSYGTPGLGISNTPSPISTGPISASVSVGRPITPPPAALPTPDPSPADTVKPAVTLPMTPQTPIRKEGINLANEADNIDPGISPRSIARLSPERRKPTVREPIS
jgi:DNA repair exonuclease SbcCD ATPase subunit